MTTTYGEFPGVKVEVAGGAISAISVGGQEKLLLIGAADYDDSTDEITGTASANEVVQVNARGQSETEFGDSELAQAMRDALRNGASLDLLYAVAPERIDTTDETVDDSASASGTLDNAPIWEDTSLVDFGSGATVEFRYDGAPTAPSTDDTVFVNPLTGEYTLTSGSVTGIDASADYRYLDWSSTFSEDSVQRVIAENESGIWAPLTESDSVSVEARNTVGGDPDVSDDGGLRDLFQMINVVSPAEPNDNRERDGNTYAGYDTANYGSASQSVDADFYFKFAPARLLSDTSTITGGVGGVYAGNPLTDAVYNAEVEGFDKIEQRLTRTDAQNLRDEKIIPIRQNGSVRIKDNLSTSTETDWERDFWRRRIADRLILIAKNVGDNILGRINDEETRESAERQIRQEIRELVDDRILRPNTADETNYFVDVYEDADDPDKVNIDLGFTPFGIVKRVETSITIRT